MEKNELMEIIKNLIKVNPKEKIEINENYLQYFSDEELINIINSLQDKKNNSDSSFLDEVYKKTKKD